MGTGTQKAPRHKVLRLNQKDHNHGEDTRQDTQEHQTRQNMRHVARKAKPHKSSQGLDIFPVGPISDQGTNMAQGKKKINTSTVPRIVRLARGEKTWRQFLLRYSSCISTRCQVLPLPKQDAIKQFALQDRSPSPITQNLYVSRHTTTLPFPPATN